MLIDNLAYGGGAERQFAGLAIALYRHGYNINVIAYHTKHGFQKDLEDIGIPHVILNGLHSQLSKLRAVKNQLIRTDPDLVISFKDGPNKIACIIKAMGARWKLIVSDRNTIQNNSYSIRIQYSLLYNFADAIIPNSFSQKIFIDKYFPKLNNKVHVITNFTDTELFHPKSKLTEDNTKMQRILVVARICQQKNVLNFIEAAKLLQHKWKGKVKISWYGKINVDEDKYAQHCYSLIKQYKLQDFIEFRETVRNIEGVYRQYDFFCLPSLWEGFPNALCEAMASGLPVCTSKICDNEKIINDHNNGILFSPFDPKDIASKLDELLSLSIMERKGYSENARTFAIENFSIKSFSDKYIQVINSLN